MFLPLERKLRHSSFPPLGAEIVCMRARRLGGGESLFFNTLIDFPYSFGALSFLARAVRCDSKENTILLGCEDQLTYEQQIFYFYYNVYRLYVN